MIIGRKSQIALFIIIGALIVIIVGILIYSARTKEEAEKAPLIQEAIEFPAELKSLGAFVQACLVQESEKTINVTAIQGGRPLAPRHAYEWEGMTLSHGYYYGLNEIPTLEEMQDEMAGHLQIHLNDCLNNLQSFKDKGMNLVIGEMSPSFEVGSDAVLVELNYPITLKKETGDVKVERFNVAVPSRLGYLHDAARRIVEMMTKEKKVGLDFISTLDITMIITPKDEVLRISLWGYNKKTQKGSFFMYLESYPENIYPQLEEMDPISARVGTKVSFDIKVSNPDEDTLTFKDYTDLFDIDPETGHVEFTAAEAGYYPVKVEVSDGKGGYDQTVISIHIY